MKDYYQILGLPENCSQADIKKEFRKLAFKYHPDTNCGDKQAEQKFKEVYEAYGVLGDEEKRRQYDRARRSPFAHAGFNPGFNYSQQDIFRNSFSNRTMFDEISRMFAQGGLRFDPEFLNRVFTSGNSTVFHFYTAPGGYGEFYQTGTNQSSRPQEQAPVQKQGPIDRWLSKTAAKLGKFVLSSLFGLQNAAKTLDHYTDFEVSAAEAAAGGERELVYSRDGELKKFLVKVPAGITAGTKIRLRGMGKIRQGRAGDLYLKVVIKD
ncbi:MAG: DnaJ domain-containing protein [Dehalococcoidales bacterium]|nr:DnaJ domain-containing protein [Dehalococcoidales bacterium]